MTEGLPERTLEPGDMLFVEGESSSTVVVLVDGELVIESGGVVVDRHATPGPSSARSAPSSHKPRSATVTAVAATVVREIGDPDEFFATYPQLGLEVARQLAGRLHRLTAYIADVQHQFAERDDHLGVFAELLGRIGRPPDRHRARLGPLTRLLSSDDAVAVAGGRSRRGRFFRSTSPRPTTTTNAPGHRRGRAR